MGQPGPSTGSHFANEACCAGVRDNAPVVSWPDEIAVVEPLDSRLLSPAPLAQSSPSLMGLRQLLVALVVVVGGLLLVIVLVRAVVDDPELAPPPTAAVATAVTRGPRTTQPVTTQPFAAAVSKEQATELLGQLVVVDRAVVPPYSRDAFGGWLDEDGDCRNTRDEVLAAESVVPVGGGCSITSGRWESPYEGTVILAPEEVDVDHLVALANAWESGAWGWDDARRAAYANDLAHSEHLVGVSASVNRSKGARSPDEWMIPSRSKETRCSYLVNWVVIKARWDLSVTSRELDTLQRGLASQCDESG